MGAPGRREVHRLVRRTTWSIAMACCLRLSTGCSDPAERPTGSLGPPKASVQACSYSKFADEPELFGAVYESGNKWCESVLVRLVPDSLTSTRLYWGTVGEAGFSNELVTDPSYHLQFGWWDPSEATFGNSTGCSPGTGGINSYITDGAVAPESHGHDGVEGPTWSPAGDGGGGGPALKERHCIRPGRYQFTVSIPNSGYSVTLPLDYVQAIHGTPVPPNSDYVEAEGYDPALNAHDLRVRVDFPLNGLRGSDTPNLEIDLLDTLQALTAAFANVPNPQGTAVSRFRFRVRDSATWNGSDTSFSGGRVLARLFWDTTNLADRTGFFDLDSYKPQTLIRHHRFENPADTVKYYYVGVELRRPDEMPLVAPALARPIKITRIRTDLAIDSLRVQETLIRPGTPVHVQVHIRNKAGIFGATEPPGWVRRFYLSTDAVIDASDAVLRTDTMTKALPRLQPYSDTVLVTLPADLGPLDYRILVHLDTMSAVPRQETDETTNNRGASAAFRVLGVKMESDSVWRITDQLFTMDSLPGGYWYRWQPGGGAWSPWSRSPRFEFAGWNTGLRTIIAKYVQDTLAVALTLTDTVKVGTARLFITGPTSVTTTAVQSYKATSANGWKAKWFIRGLTQSAWTQIGPSQGDSLLSYSWAPGCYTKYLRAQDSTGAWLRRGKVTVTVANQSPCN